MRLLAALALVVALPALGSLDFSGNSASVVNVGSDASLDDLNQGTLLAWIYPSSLPTDPDTMGIFRKDTLILWVHPWEGGRFEFAQTRATQSCLISSPSTELTVGAWNFIAVAYDLSGSSTDQKLFVGGLRTLAAEVGSYNIQRPGSGAIDTNAAADLIIGNAPGGGNNFKDFIGWIAVYNVVLSREQIRAHQWNVGRCASGCVLNMRFGEFGTGNQPDRSGTGNHGTVTSAVAADAVPVQ